MEIFWFFSTSQILLLSCYSFLCLMCYMTLSLIICDCLVISNVLLLPSKISFFDNVKVIIFLLLLLLLYFFFFCLFILYPFFSKFRYFFPSIIDFIQIQAAIFFFLDFTKKARRWTATRQRMTKIFMPIEFADQMSVFGRRKYNFTASVLIYNCTIK